MNLLALGGSFVSPAVGAGTAVIGQMVNLSVDQVRSGKLHRTIWKLYGSQMPLALSCGLETMSDLYCQAEDSFRLLDLQARSYDTSATPNPLWRGFDLLGRRMPTLIRWLDRIRNGVPPADPTQAARQIAARQKLFAVDTVALAGIGSINETISLYQAAKSPDDRKRYVHSLISNFAAQLAGVPSGSVSGGGGAPNVEVFRSFEPSGFIWACWLARGFRPDCPAPPESEFGATAELLQKYVRESLLPSVDDGLVAKLGANWEGLVARVSTFVGIEFANTITANASTLLADAFARPDRANLSPRAILGQIVAFLDEMLSKDTGRTPVSRPRSARRRLSSPRHWPTSSRRTTPRRPGCPSASASVP